MTRSHAQNETVLQLVLFTTVPTAPSFDSLIRSNSTFASINLNAWSDNGCPIMNFMVQYKIHIVPDWIMLSNNIIPEQRQIIISDLMPANWYDVVMTAYSEAGSTEAQYRFGTLTLDGGKNLPSSSYFLTFPSLSISTSLSLYLSLHRLLSSVIHFRRI